MSAAEQLIWYRTTAILKVKRMKRSVHGFLIKPISAFAQAKKNITIQHKLKLKTFKTFLKKHLKTKMIIIIYYKTT